MLAGGMVEEVDGLFGHDCKQHDNQTGGDGGQPDDSPFLPGTAIGQRAAVDGFEQWVHGCRVVPVQAGMT